MMDWRRALRLLFLLAAIVLLLILGVYIFTGKGSSCVPPLAHLSFTSHRGISGTITEGDCSSRSSQMGWVSSLCGWCVTTLNNNPRKADPLC